MSSRSEKLLRGSKMKDLRGFLVRYIELQRGLRRYLKGAPTDGVSGQSLGRKGVKAVQGIKRQCK